MERLILYIVLLILIGTLLRLLIRKPAKTSTFHYTSRNPLTPRESAFFKRLESAVGQDYYIFPQVHLSSLANHAVQGQNWKAAKSHIDRKSLDFVLCEKTSLTPVLAIELDDPTHKLPERMHNDRVKEGILYEINLPLLRINANDIPDENTLSGEVGKMVKKENKENKQ